MRQIDGWIKTGIHIERQRQRVTRRKKKYRDWERDREIDRHREGGEQIYREGAREREVESEREEWGGGGMEEERKRYAGREAEKRITRQIDRQIE